MKIGEILVEQGMISQEDVQQGLKAQKRRGGKLGTNLVALNLISDQALACALGSQFDLPCANWNDFDEIHSDIIDLVSAEFVEIHAVVPLRQEKELLVAAGAPLQDAIVDSLKASANVPVKIVIAPEIWISAALEHYYNISRQWASPLTSNEAPSEGHDLLWEVPGAIDLPSPKDINAEESSSAALIQQLFKATSPKEVMDFGMEFIWRVLPRQAVFLVNGMQIEGWMVRGLPTHVLLFAETSLAKSDASLFSSIIDEHSEFHGSLPTKAKEQQLFEYLHLGEKDQIHLFPVRSFGKTVGVFMGLTSSSANMDEKELEEVRWAMEKMGLAFSRVALGHEIQRMV